MGIDNTVINAVFDGPLLLKWENGINEVTKRKKFISHK